MTALHELDVRHLLAFDAVATEGTFARAAERLGYTQSAVSQQIAALERIVGDRLFDRPGGPRPVELTPLGAHLLAHGRHLLGELDVIGDDIDRFRHGDVGRLRVGTFQSVSATVLPLIVGPMRATHPGVDISVFESDLDDELHARLTMGELDVSFVVGTPSGLECRHLFSDPFVLIARPDQFPPGPVPVADLVGQPLVGQHANSCQLLNEAGLRAVGLDPNYVFRTNDNGTVAAMVRAGMGVAVLPALCTEPEDPRVALHRLDPPIPDREISIAWRAGRTLSPAATHFIALAAEATDHVVDHVRRATSA